MTNGSNPVAVPIAVVMPALNAAAHLRTALASLAVQDGNREVVLVDGGSRDDTLSIAAAYEGVRVVSAPGTSIYQALNRGIAETGAPAIVLLNTDDALLSGALAAWRDALARAPECGMARGRVEFIECKADGTAAPMVLASMRAARPLTIDLILRGPCAINSLCIRRTVFERIGVFDTRYRLAADREWLLRAHRAGIAVAEIGQPVYRYTSHPGSHTIDRARRNHAQMRREHLDIAARHLAGTADRQLAGALRRWHAAETGMLAWHQARHGAVGDLAMTLADASRRAPGWPLALAGEVVRHMTGRRRPEATGSV